MRPPTRRVEFKVGKKVEIINNERGLVDSFYEGTIVSCLDNDQYEVRYKTLREDDGTPKPKKPLKETKPLSEIRPLPPRVRRQEFQCGQTVDAFDNDGWWMGQIINKYPDATYKWMYKVYFRINKEEIWYPAKKVRIHQDWVDGQWIKSPPPAEI